MTLHLRKVLLISFFILSCHVVYSQDTIRYTVIFPNAVHHECEISLLLLGFENKPLHLVMSNSSPGRYANHLFAKNIYGISAFSIEDEPVPVDRVESNEWVVTSEHGYIKINYTLYANHPDGTYSGIDRHFIHLNMPSAFIWIKGYEHLPIKVDFEFHPERNWKVATQLKSLSGSSYFAPNMSYFMDSPTVISNFDSRQFTIEDRGKDKLFRVIYNPDANDTIEDKFTDKVRKVVKEQMEIFGELPDFEYGEYTFLGNFSRAYHGDGMEHRNSTMITMPRPLAGNEMNFIGTFSHEFFHCWNVERLRPASLQPFDFTKANICPELWFAEGFTSYYGPLTLFRAGVYDTTGFLNELGGMLNYVLNSPGTGKYSLVTMSEKAPFIDASRFIDGTNFKNTFTSYYPYGAVIGLALDLSIRAEFSDRSLDGFMKYLWQNYGKNEVPFTNKDLEGSLTKYLVNEQLSQSFFDKYIYGIEVPEFDLLLKQVGFSLQIKDSTQTDLTTSDFTFKDGILVYNTHPKERSTFYAAGLAEGDEVLSMNGNSIESKEVLEEFFSQLKIGEPLKITFRHFDEKIETITLVKSYRSYKIVDLAAEEKPLNDRQIRMRESWLKSKVLD